MSKETKNSLIESFLKLHEYAAAPRPDKLFGMSPPPQSGVKVNLPGPSSITSPTAAPPVASASPSTSAFKANMGQPSQGTTAGSAYQPRTYDQKVSDVQKNYSINPVGTKTSNLRVGSSGDQVSYVQRQLGVNADKQYGDDTKKAVMDFQKRNNLKVDGIVGDQTLSALKRAEAMGKLQSTNKDEAAAKERTNFSGPPSGSAAPIKTAPTNFSGGRTGFSGNASEIKPVPIERSTNMPTLTRVARNSSGGIDPNAVKRAAEELKRRQEIQKVKESTEMSNKLIEAFMKLQSLNTSNIFEAAKKAKKLDPVGKEDEDIDNDGDKDKTDSYLHNRRKKIAAAMKEDVTSLSSMGIKGPSYAKPKKEKEEGPSPKGDLPANVAKSMERERETNKEIGEPGSRQRGMIDSAKDAANRAGGLRSVEAIAKGVGAAYGQGIAKAVDAVAGYKKPESKVYQNTGKSSIALKNEEVEQIDEIKRSTARAAEKQAKKMAANPHLEDDEDRPRATDRDSQWQNIRRMRIKKLNREEVEFSDAELAHIAAILEGPVAPTPDDYSPKAFGSTASRSGTLTDEAIAEEEAKRGRGRPKGSKSGSKHGEGGNASGVTHLVDQIKHARTRGIADGKGNYMLRHEHGTNKDGSPKVHTAAVSQKASNEFYSAYHGTEKPAAKQDLHDKFVAKHFNISKPKATGITLPKMPSAKS